MDNHSEWTYWVGAIIWRMHEGVLQFLVQDVRSTKAQYSRYGVQIKFPGGNALVAYDEKNFRPELQLARELHEETYLTLLSMGPEIHREFKPPEHWQFFFLVEWAALTGELRKVHIIDGDSIIGPPRWINVDELGEELIYITHQVAYRQAKAALERAHLVA